MSVRNLTVVATALAFAVETPPFERHSAVPTPADTPPPAQLLQLAPPQLFVHATPQSRSHPFLSRVRIHYSSPINQTYRMHLHDRTRTSMKHQCLWTSSVIGLRE
ncbi:hypothetical protein BKA62DRAFT_714994 [Auriculariales sp. MPI-PUGE-AT-0066]|nr:hypothetical protein BKA62DRAFT_714994 [Auriculariales sp. MPI-PUGE-AT-0066]